MTEKIATSSDKLMKLLRGSNGSQPTTSNSSTSNEFLTDFEISRRSSLGGSTKSAKEALKPSHEPSQSPAPLGLSNEKGLKLLAAISTPSNSQKLSSKESEKVVASMPVSIASATAVSSTFSPVLSSSPIISTPINMYSNLSELNGGTASRQPSAMPATPSNNDLEALEYIRKRLGLASVSSKEGNR